VIVCRQCGHHNETGATFCGQCGKFLEWVGEKLEEGRPEETVVVLPEAGTDDRTSRPGFVERVKEAVGVSGRSSGRGSESEQTEPVPLPEPPSVSGGASVAEPGTGAVAETPGEASGVSSTSIVRDENEPQAMKPDTERPRKPPRQTRLKTNTPVHHGDLVCGQCGEPNDPERRFCRRCGARLDGARVAKVPWWRRVFQRKPKPASSATTSALGTSRRIGVSRWRSLWSTARTLLMLGLLVAVIAGVALNRGAILEWIQGKLSPPDQIHVLQMDASSELVDHEAALTVDRVNTTYWAAQDPTENGVGQYLVASFDNRVSLEKLIITPGNQEEPGTFATQPAPRDIRMIYLDPRGERLGDDTCRIPYEAKPFECEIKSPATNIGGVRIVIRAVYTPTQGTDAHVAISELEFFGEVTTREE
jgi:ribosomal protein L40E